MKTRMIATIFLLALSTSSFSHEHFKLWKAYSGKITSNQQAGRELRRNTRKGIVVSDISTIQCKRKTRFGIGYHVIFESASPANFELTWHYPHLQEEKGKSSHTRKQTVRRPDVSDNAVEWALWTLDKDELRDGDIVLVLRRGDEVYLHHVFQIRGCDKPEEPELKDEAAAKLSSYQTRSLEVTCSGHTCGRRTLGPQTLLLA